VKRPLRALFLFLIVTGFCLPASAIIFYSTGDASHNTNAPTGALENSGWQWQGEWSGNQPYWEYLGTPIARHYFITAKHTGGTTSWDFRYKGVVYTPVAYTNDPSSDLQIWKVKEGFDSYAPIYTNSDESGRGCVIFGRGLPRGDLVETTRTNGWKWGVRDNVMRWGTNVITGIYLTDYLMADFDGGGSNECTVADKDSGGAHFIKDDAGVWRLAGISYGVAPTSFSTNSSGTPSFNAACFDYRGLWYQSDTNWLYGSGGQLLKQTVYTTRISTRYAWITNVIGDELDQDVDLLPDWWEKEHTGSATAMSASAHSDSDGFSNLEEWIADTNPTNRASFFNNTGAFTLTNQTFTFTGSTARLYRVYYTTNDLTDPGLIWNPAHSDPVWGAGSNTSITVTNTEDAVFYRLRVTLP
jgi:hypothetical protein